MKKLKEVDILRKTTLIFGLRKGIIMIPKSRDKVDNSKNFY